MESREKIEGLEDIAPDISSSREEGEKSGEYQKVRADAMLDTLEGIILTAHNEGAPEWEKAASIEELSDIDLNDANTRLREKRSGTYIDLIRTIPEYLNKATDPEFDGATTQYARYARALGENEEELRRRS